MRGGISVAIVVLGIALLCSGCKGQGSFGADWLSGLQQSLGTLNRNIQENVQDLNRRVQNRVQENLAQTQRLVENLNEEIASGRMNAFVGSMVTTNNDGTTVVQSGRTSNGRLYVRESNDQLVGDILRHVDRIYDPATNTTRVVGYTLDLKDPNAEPVAVREAA